MYEDIVFVSENLKISQSKQIHNPFDLYNIHSNKSILIYSIIVLGLGFSQLDDIKICQLNYLHIYPCRRHDWPHNSTPAPPPP